MFPVQVLIMATTNLNSFSLFVLFIAVIAVCLSATSVVAQSEKAAIPTRTLGDEWTYSVDSNQTGPINGTMTMEVTNTSMKVNGLDCNEITGVSRGTVSGNITAWTINLREYDVKADYSIAKTYANMESSGLGGPAILLALNSDNSFSSTTETTYNPPLAFGKGFPLFVGENWTAQTTENTTSSMTIMGSTTNDNYIQATTTNFTVQRTEDTKVPAGEFQTYVINSNKNDGTSRELYYSPKAEMQVKELDYDSKGNLAETFELLNYNVSGGAGSSPVLEMAAVGLGIAALALGLSLLFLARKKKTRNLDHVNET